jgi:hypothetical protein
MNEPEIKEVYSQAYFLDGIRSGLSNYENYSWKGDLTLAMATRFLEYLAIHPHDAILDYGCSRGYFVKALTILGMDAYGKDISLWAIENSDPMVKDRVSNQLYIAPNSFDWINAKDVLEHIKYPDLAHVIRQFVAGARKGIFIIVPLVKEQGGEYLRPEDQQDITHQIRWTLEDWLKFLQFHAPDFIVNGSYHIPNLKAASLKVPYSCGFFTLLRFQ